MDLRGMDGCSRSITHRRSFRFWVRSYALSPVFELRRENEQVHRGGGRHLRALGSHFYEGGMQALSISEPKVDFFWVPVKELHEIASIRVFYVHPMTVAF